MKRFIIIKSSVVDAHNIILFCRNNYTCRSQDNTLESFGIPGTYMNQDVVSATQRLNPAFEPLSVSASGDDVHYDIQSPEYAYAYVNKTPPSPTANVAGVVYAYADLSTFRPRSPQSDIHEDCVEKEVCTTPGYGKITESPGNGNDQEGCLDNSVYAHASTTEEGWAENNIYNLE